MRNMKKVLLTLGVLTVGACAATAFAACGDKDSDKHEHSWGDWTVVTQATCGEAGVEERVCADDATHTETRVIPALNHNFVDWDITNPTGSGTGSATASCSHTGCTATANKTLPALMYSGYQKTEDTATCTEAGSVKYSITVDGVELSFDVDTPAKGHSYGDWAVIALEDSEGQATKECSAEGCDEYVTVDLPALSARGAYNIEDTANCVVDGKLIYTYTTEDGEEIKISEEDSPAKGHNYVGPAFNEAADGAKANATWECDRCHDKDVAEYDEAFESALSALEDGKTYYGHSSVAASASSAATKGIAFNIASLPKGIYEFNFRYTCPQVLNVVTNSRTLVNGKAMFANGEIAPAYKDNVSIVYEDGRVVKLIVNVDGVKIEENKRFTFSMTTSVEPGETVGCLIDVKIIADKIVNEGENDVKITEAHGFADVYKFVSATDKEYSITVPQGMSVAIGENQKTIIDGSGDSYNWANFEATAGEEVIFTFSYSEVGTYKVTIGEPIAIPELTVGCDNVEVSMVSGEVGKVVIGEGVEEGNYTIIISGAFLIGRGVGYANLYFMAGGDGTYETVTGSDGLFLNVTKGKGTQGDYSYDCGNGTCKVTMTLKAGDTLYFAPAASFIPAGNTIASILVTMSEAAE